MTASTVRLILTSDLILVAALRRMAAMYLPEGDVGDRWTVDRFTWYPSDENLAALPFPLVPDSDTLDPAGPGDGGPIPEGGPAAYYGQVVLTDVPDHVNPGSGLGLVSGVLSAATVRVNRGRITAEIGIARRIPFASNDHEHLAISPADIAVDFPGITPEDVDPELTPYDVRLAHP